MEKSISTIPVTGGDKEISEGASTFTDSNATEIVLVTQNSTGDGLSATTSSGTAVLGAASTSGIGVKGTTADATGITYGVWGKSVSTTGRGGVWTSDRNLRGSVWCFRYDYQYVWTRGAGFRHSRDRRHLRDLWNSSRG